MRKLVILLTLTIGVLASCCTQQTPTKIEKHTVVRVFMKRPISIHDEISPSFYAVLENGDIVPVSHRIRPGDTLTYKYYQYVEK